MRVNGDGEPGDHLASHAEGPGFPIPMTVVIVDQTNTAVRVAIAPEGLSSH